MQSDFRENLKLALDTVRAHKLRSFLAILGVMIGVALIILVVGLVQGFREMRAPATACRSPMPANA